MLECFSTLYLCARVYLDGGEGWLKPSATLNIPVFFCEGVNKQCFLNNDLY